ncbi:hypothetical protein BC830DRAFT_824698 [Chytriomyces sp. MP71]|nr:hypothetical protein BC830DRAFT_824698 [Chytriomyces sp. MP71]
MSRLDKLGACSRSVVFLHHCLILFTPPNHTCSCQRQNNNSTYHTPRDRTSIRAGRARCLCRPCRSIRRSIRRSRPIRSATICCRVTGFSRWCGRKASDCARADRVAGIIWNRIGAGKSYSGQCVGEEDGLELITDICAVSEFEVDVCTLGLKANDARNQECGITWAEARRTVAAFFCRVGSFVIAKNAAIPLYTGHQYPLGVLHVPVASHDGSIEMVLLATN